MSRNWLEMEKWTCFIIFALGSDKRRFSGALTWQSWQDYSQWILGVLQTERFPRGFDLHKVSEGTAQQELKGRSSGWMGGGSSVYSFLHSAELGFQMTSGWVIYSNLDYGKIKYY